MEARLRRRDKHAGVAVVGGNRPHRDSGPVVPAVASVLESGPERVDHTAGVPTLAVGRSPDEPGDRRPQPVGPDHDAGSHPAHGAAALLDHRADHSSVRGPLEVDQPRTVNDVGTRVRGRIGQQRVDAACGAAR